MSETNIEQILLEDGVYISTTSGVSMYPLLRDRRDTIVVTPCSERLKKYDVALYRRGPRYVLHRVIKVHPDSYVIRGDNCIASEYVPDKEILGKLTGVYRAEKPVKMNGVKYNLYSRAIVFLHPFVTLKFKMNSIKNRRRR